MLRRLQNVAESGAGALNERATDTGAANTIAAWLHFAWQEVVDFAIANPYIAVAAIAALVRACGVTVATGQTGLLFSFGRVKRRLEPGFKALVPFLQIARVVPTRSRTIELGAQRVVTLEGLVFHCRANLVWRIAEVEKALIEVDDLDLGMRNVLAICVQQVLHGQSREALHNTEMLDARLRLLMDERLAPWGVVVERTGFQSIAPSPRTVGVTQLRERVATRHAMYESLLATGLSSAAALGLVGTRHFPRRRALAARRRDGVERRSLRAAAARRGVLRNPPKLEPLSTRLAATRRGMASGPKM